MDFHYILVLSQAVRGLGNPVVTQFAGVACFRPGTTFDQAYTELFGKYAAQMREATRISAEPVTAFFSLNRNDLEA